MVLPLDIVRMLGILKIPIDLYKDHKKLGREMKNELQSLVSDLEYLMRDHKNEGWTSYDELRLTELVYDIEDFAQGLWILEASDYALSAIGMNPREKELDRIKFFQKEIEKLETRQKKSSESKSEDGGGSHSASSSSSSSSSADGGYTSEESLVGISEPKKVLLDLLKKPASSKQAGGQDDEQPPKVISIVGCPGVGKTALARAVYDHARGSDEFECVAWVEASRCNDKTALLGKIGQEVQADLASIGTLSGILANKRYLVFIDDVQQAKMWKDTVRDFPKNGKSSIVIVTTSVHSVADVCSSGSYVYTMKCLGETESNDLLWRGVYPDGSEPAPALITGSESILAICGGLPLALINVAKHLSINATKLDRNYCDKVGKELGSHLAGSKAEEFMELRRVLGQCYEGLPDYDHKNCMLSLSIFPRNHPIKSKSLVRRLVAEGLVAGDGHKCLDELVNLCIVEPVQISRCSKDIKNCRVNGGIMLEFIIRKSQSRNLVTLIRGEEFMHNNAGRIRRLSVQSSTKDKVHDIVAKNKLSETVRSLTIITSEEIRELFEIKRCKFLRLLDLEGCRGLNDEEVFSGICKLVYLKYLSLRNTDVNKIPQEIKNLRCLQTLDIRETREIELPEEVVTLPKLAFLFGKFVLPKMSNKTKEFLSTKSELHTLAGFVVDKKPGSEHIILVARNLKKIEVWCRAWVPLETKEDFVLSLRSHLISLDSVSIEFDQLSQNILASLARGPCRIKRMKLQGKLDSLPAVDTLSMLNNLNKLQLYDTRLTSDDLSILQHISCLEYLKLQDNQNDSWDGSFSVLKDGFESLRRLCFQASKLPKLQFDAESMKSLISLHLLCPDISQMTVSEEISKSISHIKRLDEVVLHPSASKEIVEAWKTAAKNNANRPRVNQRS